MIAAVFALPEESRDFRAALAGSTAASAVRVTHCGVGPAAAARHIAEALSEHPELLISAGFAGGLDPALHVGDLAVATNYSHPLPLALAESLTGARFGPFVSVELPAESVAEKAALAGASGAIAVDMETGAIASACKRLGVPLLAVRAISDPADAPLPVPFPEWFDLARQRPRPVRLCTFLARHPSRILPFARFVRGLTPARKNLAAFLLRFIEARVRATG
jgi:adenosylhomocysteine nucleosidase